MAGPKNKLLAQTTEELRIMSGNATLPCFRTVHNGKIANISQVTIFNHEILRLFNLTFQKLWNYIKYKMKLVCRYPVCREVIFRTLKSTNTFFMPHTYWEYCFTVNMQQLDGSNSPSPYL